MNQTLEQNVLAECYGDMAIALDKLCWKFKQRYGGNFEDLRAEANLQFIYAHNLYKTTMAGTYEYWVTFRVWKCLLEQARHKARRLTKKTFIALDETFDVPLQDTSQNMVDLLDSIGQDARDIVSLIVDAPAELEAMVIRRGRSPKNVRSGVTAYLRHKIGWTIAQVKEAMMEVEVAVNG